MASKPAYLHGRGRGRGNAGVGRASPQPNSGRPGAPKGPDGRLGGVSSPQRVAYSKVTGRQSVTDIGDGLNMNNDSKKSAEQRFQDVASKHQESVQRHLLNVDDEYESSDEEEDMNDDDILNSVLKSFRGTTDHESQNDLGRTHEYLINSMKSKANTCLICIETIKRMDAVWSCHGCYAMLHVSCIQKWVRDGVYQRTAFSEENIPEHDLPWFCPKCRQEYKQTECPTRYFCFCGKDEDPRFDPWLVPHSCGQVCGRSLKPDCGHSCLLLCHPGPCPPCPQTVRVACHCGVQSPKTRRCGAREWSCGQPCKKPLTCEHHSCIQPCHKGECPACPETSVQSCDCGRDSCVRPCASPSWQCDQVCGKALSCGHHTCEKVCHAAECGACPRAGTRTCPCGKTTFQLPCTKDAPTCMSTCDNMLDCGRHQCTQRCHTGPCGVCRQMTEKRCPCGQKAKQVPCFKEFLCETRCARMKNCGKHVCKRKCCDGNCPSCEQPCGRTLGCRNHKCASRCHTGLCYPCPLTVTISCNCKQTSVTVPCGAERITKPPRCKKRCQEPPDCHHESRLPHRCHFGRCPSCKHVCDRSLPNCHHFCPAVCHAAVLTKIQEKVRRAGPWEAMPETQLKVLNKPCPPCQVMVPKPCLGGHEVFSMKCFEARVTSCHRPCGRLLECTNHACQLECHKVVNASDDHKSGDTCQRCDEPCQRPRPDGCGHACLLPCHPGDCAPCRIMIRMRCHCQLVVQHIPCDQWTHADDRERQRLKSCHSSCPKMLPCGHKCKSTCHPNECPNLDRCTEKVKVRCSCRRRKQDFLCNEVQAGYAHVECDETCTRQRDRQKKDNIIKRQEQAAKVARLAHRKAQKRKATEHLMQLVAKCKKDKDEAETVHKQQEEQRQKQEYEEYERKIHGRKRKPRKPRHETNDSRFLQRYGKFIIAPLLIVLLALFVYFLLQQ